MNRPILATGFVADDPAQGSVYPSAGGNSADPKVQAIYWRCILVLFASARMHNPDLRLLLFSNVAPPTVDGHDLGPVFDRLGVEHRMLPLSRRLPREKTPSWGNVLYFLDIMHSLSDEPDDTRFLLVDSDVVVMQSLAPLFDRVGNCDFVVYDVETAPGVMVNGMSRADMTVAAGEVFGREFATPAAHFGGELFGCTLTAWRAHAARFDALFDRAMEGVGAAGMARTEEHVFSILLAGLDAQVCKANGAIRRIWTSPRHSTVRRSDTDLALWHLPAEKRYGLGDLFADLMRRGGGTEMGVDEFRRLALRRCGLPRKSLTKVVHDGVRQVAVKLGLRT